jgi:hypothetical protein
MRWEPLALIGVSVVGLAASRVQFPHSPPRFEKECYIES